MKYYPKRVSQYINNVLLTQKHSAEKQNTVANFYLGLGSEHFDDPSQVHKKQKQKWHNKEIIMRK